jgi:hypothetical protein
LPLADHLAEIDKRLSEWRQGDVVLGDAVPFVCLADLDQPITTQAREFANHSSHDGKGLAAVSTEVPGFAVITQSCDLVRSCGQNPFVTLAALIEVDASMLKSVMQGMRPRFACVPGVADRQLVADLHSTTTVEKAILSTIPAAQRIRGCTTDLESREFAAMVAHGFGRAALPDDFNEAVKSMQRRIREKHGKPTQDSHGAPTNEGSLLSALREIRITFAPSRDAPNVDLTFWFVFNSRADIPTDGDEIVENLVEKFKVTGRFKDPAFRLVTLSEISAEAYLTSDRLDLDYLS